MTRDTVKTYTVEAAVAALAPGPWTAWNPLRPGWAVLPPWGGAWARYRPLENEVEISLHANVKGLSGAQATDGYVIGLMPETDAVGNNLWPQQNCRLLAGTDAFQTVTPRSPLIMFTPGGQVQCFGISTATTVVSVHFLCYSLDDMSGGAS
jgi:hypothetical protein